ncbi:hemophore-related protein [Mycobacterium sp. UM_CSW]|uniref:hemophore-related protein n=1 Tax=Mycobacterium sp. UM_CSW TaxID=1370119 RepID=UPI0004275F03|nr:hemophore-related protein [Mycobacterium sp. UM_CSW]
MTGADGAVSTNPEPQPDQDWIVNTKCSFPQFVAALNAEDIRAAQQFAITPAAQSWVGSYLASSPDQRRQMLRRAQSIPDARQYIDTMLRVASTCKNF